MSNKQKTNDKRNEGCEAISQNDYISDSKTCSLTNESILSERINLTMENDTKLKNCYIVYDKETHKRVGIIPRIQVKDLWTVVSKTTIEGYDGICGFNKTQVDENFAVAFKFLKANKKNILNENIIQDFFQLGEVEYESLFLKKSVEFGDFIKYAIEQDIKETRKIVKAWGKIKSYPFKLPLDIENGGIFSHSDVKILNDNKIFSLNDLRKLSVYDVRNMFLSHPIDTIPKEINEAIKKDWKRRKDSYYKVVPYVFQYITALPIIVLGFMYKYTLLKNTRITYIIFALLAVWLVGIVLGIIAPFRAIKRRKKDHLSYYYFTKKVLKTFVVCGFVSLFMFGQTSLFYERYDGYNDIYYYRNVGDNKIAIAGLRNEEEVSLIIPNDIDLKEVVEIDKRAFKKTDIESVVIPDSVTFIDKSAFLKCENLSEVVMSENVRSVSKKQFAGCSNLRNIDLSHIEQIGDSAFTDCLSLESINLGNKLTTIGKKTFKGCTFLFGIVVPNEVTYIGDDAFADCLSLRSFTAPFMGNSIDDCEEGFEHIFGDNFCVQTVTIKKGNSVSSKMFSGAYSLTTINLPDTVTNIDSGAFKGLSNLKNINIPNGVTEINDETFKDCICLSNITGCGSLKKIGNSAFEGSGITNNFFNSLKLESIGENAFSGCDSLYDINIPNGITYIGTNAFTDCTSLKTFTAPFIGNSIDDSGEGFKHIFGDNFSVQTVTVKNVDSILSKTFSGANSLTTINLPDTVTNIDSGAFKGLSNLKNINIPNGVTEIKDETFMGCIYLNNITGCNNVKRIGNSAFEISGITNSFFNSLKPESIGENAFRGCESLYNITIPNGVTYIGTNAFADCMSLSNVTVPFIGNSIDDSGEGFKHIFGDNFSVQTVTVKKGNSISSKTFSGAKSLITIKLPDTVTNIDSGAFKGLSNLGNINIPDGVTEIKDETFKGCTYLNNITGCNNVKRIGNSAFEGSGITNSFLDSLKLESIGDYAFRETKVTQFVVSETITSIGNNPFYNCSNLATIKLVNNRFFVLENNILYNSNKTKIIAVGKKVTGTVNIPEGLTSIDDYMFKACTGISEIVIPNSVKNIGSHTFEGCQVSTATLPLSALKYFGNSLSYVTITDGSKITKADINSFYKMKEVTLDDCVTEIDEGCFSGLYNLRKITLGKNISVIGTDAFKSCSSLSSVYYGGDVKKWASIDFGSMYSNPMYYGNLYINGSMLKEINITGINKINDYSFHSCRSLTAVSIEGVKNIGSQAFGHCYYLESVTLGEGLKVIGSSVFEGCGKLKTLSLPMSVTELADDSFVDSSLKNVEMSVNLAKYDSCFPTDCVINYK